jgi:hypothetical protein
MRTIAMFFHVSRSLCGCDSTVNSSDKSGKLSVSSRSQTIYFIVVEPKTTSDTIDRGKLEVVDKNGTLMIS